MIILYTVICAYSMFSLCDTALVDNLNKCSVKDDECVRLLYQDNLQKFAKPGVPELNLPSLDPMPIKNFTITIDKLTITMYDAFMFGIGTCVFKSIHLNLEERFSSHDLTCNLITEGKIKISGENPRLQSILGAGVIDARGKGKLTLDEARVKYDAPFNIIKKDDGEIYLIIDNDNIKYIGNIELKNATYTTEDVFLGNNNISQLLSLYFSDHWRSIMKTYGIAFVGRSGETYFTLIEKFFSGVPTKYYLIEDMSPYLKN